MINYRFLLRYFLDPDTASDLVYHTYMINRIFLKLELLYVKIKTFKKSLHFRVPIILTFTVPVVHLLTEEIISVLRSRNFLFSAPAPTLTIISAQAPATAIYWHLKLFKTLVLY